MSYPFHHYFFHRIVFFTGIFIILLIVTFCLPLFSHLYASDEPFTYPSNWGGTGLMEIPTARIMRENRIRVGVGQVKPYRYYYGAISPIKGLEVDGRITESLDVPSGLTHQNNFKDKAIDVKYQFMAESKYMPALALGIMDPHGTRIYSSQYIAASKQIYPFDFTIGFGNGRFGKKPIIDQTNDIKFEMFTNPKEWIRDSQIFWGMQFAPSDKFALMFEFNPIKYHLQSQDPAQERYFTSPVASQYNFGIRYKPTKWSEIDITYQRGSDIGINLSMEFDIGTPLIPIYDSVYREQPAERFNHYHDRITTALHLSGFSDIAVRTKGRELWIEAQNEKYFYSTRAIGIILQVIADITPEHIHNIHITLKENNIPSVTFSTTRADILELYNDRLTLSEFLYLSRFRAAPENILLGKGQYKNDFKYGFKPDIQTYLNSREGFLKYRLGVSGWGSYQPWDGASCILGLEWHPLNTVPVENLEGSSIQVRSDISLYKSRNIALGKLMFDQIKKLTPDLYARVAAGLLEVQYAGIDAEIAMPVFNGKILLGISGSAVKKRQHDHPFKMKEDDAKDYYTTGFLNSRFHIPDKEIAIDIKAGRFLAGDNGVRFTVYKHIKGVTLWAWYSYTDTSIFSDNINNDYHDKGIGISIPMRLFKGTDSKTVYNYSISPWTRDTGQDIEHHNSLFDYIGRNTKIFLDRDSKMMY